MESASDTAPNVNRARTPKTKTVNRPSRGSDRIVSATTAATTGTKSADNVNRQRPGKPTAGATLSSETINTPAKPAYAGPSFQASPAPSSLPVPRFFSRSVPAGGLGSGSSNGGQEQTSRYLLQDASSPPPQQAGISPYHNPNSRGTVNGTSVLNVLFNADRQERASQQSSGGVAQTPSRTQTPDISRQLFKMELDDAESPAARRAEKTAPVLQQRQPSPNLMDYTRPNNDFDERERATNDLKARLGLAGSATPQKSYFPVQPPVDRLTPQGRPDELLYGDRNLSPMFQAARAPSPHVQQPYPSQYVHQQQYSPYQVSATPPHQTQQSRMSDTGPIPFPLQQLKREPQYQYPPPPPPQMTHQSPPPFASSLAGNAGHQTPNQQSTLGVQDMESNLRKMLKLT